ncbi:MAG: S8 family peptidase [Elainellaceae cyanobacterium]
MKRLYSTLVATACILAIAQPFQPIQQSTAIAQAQTPDGLYYTFFGQQIPLTLRTDVVAVSFREAGSTRGGSSQPLYLQLQQDLEGTSSTTRAIRTSPYRSALSVDIEPLGTRYALVTELSGTRGLASVDQQIREQPYVEGTLPVLSLNTGDENSPELDVVLPNEILISLEPGLSNSQIQVLFNRYGLEVIRPLQFTENRYLVRSRTETGMGVLNVANRLNGVVGIQSATPNFVQSLVYRVQEQDIQDASLAITPNALDVIQQQLAHLPQIETLFSSNLLPLAWHLNSTPKRGRLLPRTDVRATQAWQQSNSGEGVVVAVLDSLIQWDHANLINTVYTLDEERAEFPYESQGWDFTSNTLVCSKTDANRCLTGDADTRISDDEVAILRPHFQNAFRLSDADLLEQYDGLANRIRSSHPNISSTQVAGIIRNIIRSEISAEFHGTWSAGVIAAHPEEGTGAIGVAPRSQILPVRVFGLGGEITSARLIEALGYAADRGADVINMSLGGVMPDQGVVDQIFQLLDNHTNLVIVASAGNESFDGVSFPAATPGVVSVGATNLDGRRTYYSSYGGRLDVVAPGGETATALSGGILTTGGTWVDSFWQGMEVPDFGWGYSLDPRGEYVQVQGTSFSAPTVSGVIALMKGENSGLGRDRLISILKETANYDGLTLSQADLNHYRLQQDVGLTLRDDRVSGIFPLPEPVSAQQYFFGNGLVNAAAAVRMTQH